MLLSPYYFLPVLGESSWEFPFIRRFMFSSFAIYHRVRMSCTVGVMLSFNASVTSVGMIMYYYVATYEMLIGMDLGVVLGKVEGKERFAEANLAFLPA